MRKRLHETIEPLIQAAEPEPQHPLVLYMLGHEIQIDCNDAEARDVLALVFAPFVGPQLTPARRILRYSVDAAAGGGYRLECPEQDSTVAGSLSALVFGVEHSLVVELQRGNAALLFFHAAVLKWNGRAILLVAESGGGKSTTSWALLQNGFQYVSDELAPVDVDAMQVFGYPHALCLKREPLPPFALPAGAIHLGGTIHVTTAQLPLASDWRLPLPLAAIFHITYVPGDAAPNIKRMSAAEATARLYVNAMNALAHPVRGMDAVARVAKRVPNFAANTGELSATCTMFVNVMRELIGP